MYLNVLTKQLRNESFQKSIEAIREIGFTHVALRIGGISHSESNISVSTIYRHIKRNLLPGICRKE